MKNKKERILLSSALLIFLIIFVNCLSTKAQDNRKPKNDVIPTPAEEVFKEAVGTVAPWRVTRCRNTYSEKDFYGNPCHTVTKDEADKREIATLYNENGSIWLRFNITDEADSISNRLNKDFVPFRGDIKGNLRGIVLRTVGESKHWLEVEINEKTRETKFVLKSDSTWDRASWDFWLSYFTTLMVDGNRTPLFDKPDGKILEESSLDSIWKVLFIKTEGDWAYVEAYINQKKFNAWVRWRKGRDILVGTVFTYHKIPEIQTDVQNK